MFWGRPKESSEIVVVAQRPRVVRVVTVKWHQLRVLRDLIDDLMSKPQHIRDHAGIMDYRDDPDIHDDRGVTWGIEEVNFMLPED